MTSAEEILKKGFVDVKVFVAGLRQSQRLEVVKQTTAQGTVPFLVCKHYVPATELVRLAEEFRLPIRHKDTVVFPRGTTPSSFTGNITIATVEADTIEAEVE